MGLRRRRRRSTAQLDLFKPVQLLLELPRHVQARRQYEALLARFVEMLRDGTPPWRRPWFRALPTNALTGRRYRGTNVLTLLEAAERRGFRSYLWLTQRQAARLGGNVRAEEEPFFTVIFGGGWRQVRSRLDDDPKRQRSRWALMLSPAYLYNREQCEGLRLDEEVLPTEHDRIEAAEVISHGYQNRPPIKASRSSAFYAPLRDEIGMPDLEWFESPESYYSTLFHELIHSTGHSARLNRFRFQLQGEGDESDEPRRAYAKEELVAEIGGALLCLEAKIENATIKDSAAYLGSWLEVLESNPRHLHSAFAVAERAVDHVLGRRPSSSEVEPPSSAFRKLDMSGSASSRWTG